MAKYVLIYSPGYFETCLWARNDAAAALYGERGIQYSQLPLSEKLTAILQRLDQGCLNPLEGTGADSDLPLDDPKRLHMLTRAMILGMIRDELGSDYEVRGALGWESRFADLYQ